MFIPDFTPDMIPPFTARDTYADPFGVVFVSDRGLTHRVANGPLPAPLPLKRRYLPANGNPSTNPDKIVKG